MNIVKQRVLERVTDVDIHLRQRFARRAVERVLRLLSRVSSQYGPRSSTIANGAGNPIPGTTLESEDYVTGSVLSGLEVFWMAAAGSTLRVSAGAVLVTNPAPGNEARPVPWTGQVENDDDAFGVYDAPLYANVTPAVPIAGALAQPEWWIVYGTPSKATIETDTNSAVFNESTGVFDVTTQPKIVGHQLARAVLRGSAGATLNATLALLPTNSVQLAWVYVPTGSTDLASATIFDVRRLALTEQGPNVIEGRWQNAIAGEALATSRVFKGDVRARHWNEWLMARMTNGVLLSDLAEPGAAWGGPSQTFNPPKIAYVYLCRVEGVVPRPARVGAYPIGNHASISTGCFMHGAVVLSPTPPKLRAGPGTGSPDAFSKSGRLWDLRPSATLHLATITLDGITYPWGGEVVGNLDAICIGMMQYAHTDASGLPQVEGQVAVDEDGWHVGPGVTGFPSDTNPFVTTTLSSAVPTTALGLVASIANVTVGGDVCCLPIDGVRFATEIDLSAAGAEILWSGEQAGEVSYATSTGGAFKVTKVLSGRTPFVGADSVIGWMIGAVFGGNATAVVRKLAGFRFPYRTPLVT